MSMMVSIKTGHGSHSQMTLSRENGMVLQGNLKEAKRLQSSSLNLSLLT